MMMGVFNVQGWVIRGHLWRGNMDDAGFVRGEINNNNSQCCNAAWQLK
jgi:hypothetical protein